MMIHKTYPGETLSLFGERIETEDGKHWTLRTEWGMAQVALKEYDTWYVAEIVCYHLMFRGGSRVGPQEALDAAAEKVRAAALLFRVAIVEKSG